MRYALRLADAADREGVAELVATSARGLGAADYSDVQIEGALKGAFGLDTQLIADRTYYVVEDGGGQLVACGGWSYRGTLFGGDQAEQRDAATLVPGRDAAKIRAFFVHPDHARRGLGTLILERCEMAAAEQGFRQAELMATLTGLKLYAARGYEPGEPVEHELAPGLTISFVPMTKTLGEGIVPLP